MAAAMFNFLVNFWKTIDENGSMMWIISENKISILYYFNDENTNLHKILVLLNSLGDGYGLAQRGWKLPFRMQVAWLWVVEPGLKHLFRDYQKRVEFLHDFDEIMINIQWSPEKKHVGFFKTSTV